MYLIGIFILITQAKRTIGDLSQQLRIKLTGVENVDTYNNKYNQWVSAQRGRKEADPEQQEKKEKKKEKKKGKSKLYVLFVQCTLTHGDRVIGESMYTGAKLYSNSPVWNEWLVIPIKLRDIPRGAKICFRLYRRQYDSHSSDVRKFLHFFFFLFLYEMSFSLANDGGGPAFLGERSAVRERKDGCGIGMGQLPIHQPQGPAPPGARQLPSVAGRGFLHR